VLAAVGLYGLLAYVVSQEMREFGIRLAIGASRGHIAALVLRRGLVSASVGLGVGVLAAQLLTRRLESLLYGVTAADPATYAVAAAIMLFVAAVASYLPARRAMRADPLESLRSE
jgi:putative ABC transport system permease protein